MPTSVVTGGAGFLGSHLCEYLLGKGYRVLCVDNLESSSLENLEHLRDDAFAFLNHDMVDHLEVDEPVDVVYHLAALASPIDYLRQPLHSLKVGSYGTHHALGLSKWKRARFLLFSTSEVYGDPLVHPQPESYLGNVSSIGPRSCYDESKRFSEAITMAYHRVHGLDVRIARIFNTYGERMRPDDGRVVNTLAVQALRGEPITLHGDGRQTRSFCHVADEIIGLAAVLDGHLIGPVNVGNPDEFTIRELAQLIVELTKSSSEIVMVPLPPEREGDPARRCPDIGLISSTYGWRATIGLAEGLTRMIEWFGTAEGIA